jgi:hypothetical protein
MHHKQLLLCSRTMYVYVFNTQSFAYTLESECGFVRCYYHACTHISQNNTRCLAHTHKDISQSVHTTQYILTISPHILSSH